MKRMTLVVATGILVGFALWFSMRRGSGETNATDMRAEKGEGETRIHPASSQTPEPPKAVPKLAARSKKNPPKISSDSQSSEYDAADLILANSSSISPAFEAEKRDPTWAPKREETLSALLNQDMANAGLEAKVVSIECHHSSCLLTLEGKDREEMRKANFLLQYTPLATVYEPRRLHEESGRGRFSAFIAYDSEYRDLENWASNYETERRRALDTLRREGVPEGYPPIPDR